MTRRASIRDNWKSSQDVQKSRFSQQYWRFAADNMSAHLKNNVKESQNILLFKGAIYKIVFNVEGRFRNTQLVILFDLPSEDDLSSWRKLKVLKDAVGGKMLSMHQIYPNKITFIVVLKRCKLVLHQNVQNIFLIIFRQSKNNMAWDIVSRAQYMHVKEIHF